MRSLIIPRTLACLLMTGASALFLMAPGTASAQQFVPYYQPAPGCGAPCPAPVIIQPHLMPQAQPVPQAQPGQPSQAQTPTTPSQTSPMAQAPTTPDADAGAERSGAAGGESVAVATPTMMGDFLLIRYGTLASSQSSSSSSSFSSSRSSSGFVVPSSSRSFKIADNESPRPLDRIIFSYQYYNNIGAVYNARNGAGASQTDVHRETFGFEKTLLDGSASLGMRLPLNTLDNGSTFTDIGDLSIVTKYAFLNDAESGNVISGGVVVTVPTGPTGFAGVSVSNPFHETVVQPWLGYIFNSGDFFVHGFAGLDIPTDSRDTTLLFNDLGVGYIYRTCSDRIITYIAPTLEVHVNDPLNHRGAFNGPAGVTDWIVLTQGVTLQINGNSTIAFGVGEPVTGLRPYDFEAFTHVNIRF